MVEVPIEVAAVYEGAQAHLNSGHSKASLEKRSHVHNAGGEEKQTGTREKIISRATVEESCKPKMSEPEKKTKAENRLRLMQQWMSIPPHLH